MPEKVSITVTPAHAREDIISKLLVRPAGVDTTLDVFPGKKDRSSKDRTSDWLAGLSNG